MTDAGQRIVRILTMIPYIRKHQGVPLDQLARYLNVPAGTVLEDIDTALMCGVPPYLPDDYVGVYVEESRVYVGFAEQFKRPVTLTFQEALALKLALRSLPTPAKRAASSLIKRIDAALPAAARRRISEKEQRISLEHRPSAIDRKLATLEKAIAANRELKMEYYTASRDTLSERTVRPYGLVDHDGQWYLVAYCTVRHGELPFRVDRIRSAELLSQRFDVPKEFNLKKYERPEMYFPSKRDLKVTIRVDAEIARWVEEEFPAKYVKRRPEGDLLLELPVSRPEWVLTWALQRAPHVEILSPQEVRERMADLCREALANYQ